MTIRGGARGPIAIATVVAKNFVAFGRVLADSVRTWHPELPVYVALADEPGPGFDPAGECYEPVAIDALGIPRLRSLCFASTRQQLTILAKPRVLGHLLDRGYETVVFLDADILVLGRLDTLLEAAAPHAVTLTPHLLDPPGGVDRLSRELNILRSGVYNGGCIVVSACDEGRRFLDWWGGRLASHCLHDPGGGLHYDQRWLDLAPSFVERLGIARDPGLNVAYWNLRERQARVEDGRWVVNGGPCRFFHFSGFDPMRPDVATRYASEVSLESLGTAARLFDTYTALMLCAGHASVSAAPYAFGVFDNGVDIPDAARGLYKGMGDAEARFDDPFETGGRRSFYRWLTEADDCTGATHRVSRLWMAIHRSRPDLQQAFPDPTGADEEAFLDWTIAHGLREHVVDRALIVPA